MPFLIGDDGYPVRELNDFFRDLPVTGCRSPETWRAYALDVFRFIRYLSTAEDVAPFNARVDHVERYRQLRLHGRNPVRPSTWNRELTALQRFYGWAVRCGHASEVPFRFGDAVGRYPKGSRVPRNHARARVGDVAPIRHLSVEQFVFFRDIGLYGLTPDGTRDPTFAGEHALRNRLFADLLVTSGLRLREAAALTRPELPQRSRTAAKLTIAGPTAKGSETRDVLIPAAVLDRLHFYIRSARAEAVERSRRSGGKGPAEQVQVEGSTVRRPDASVVDLSLIGPEHRWRLVEARQEGPDPLTLFIGRSGKPVKPQAWDRVFEAASRRCASFEDGNLPRVGRVTPHMLRHTFAVHTLTALLAEQLRRGTSEGHPGALALKYIAENPLRRLQHLLGHAQVSTTYLYLGCLDDSNELVDAAQAGWDVDVTWAELAQESA